MKTYYLIRLLHGVDSQDLPEIENKNDAKKTADRLQFFFLKQGLDVSVQLYSVEERVRALDNGFNANISFFYTPIEF